MKHKSNDRTNCNWRTRYSHQRMVLGLVDLKIGRRVETIQIVALLKKPEYWEESWRLEKTYCHSDSSEKPSANHIYQPLRSGRIWHKVNF